MTKTTTAQSPAEVTNTIMDMGDLGLRASLELDEVVHRKDVVNRDAFIRNIYPGDVFHAEEPSRRYKFFWHQETTRNSSSSEEEYLENELDDLEEKGYFKVLAKDDGHPDGEFLVKRWTRSPEGYVKSGRFILYAQPEEKYDEERLQRATHLGQEIDAHTDGFHATAENLGLGSWEVRGGVERERAKAKRTSKILDE